MPQGKYHKFELTPDEIRRRTEDLDWMKMHNFTDSIMDSVMHRDSPSMEKLRSMVSRLGAVETIKRLEKFCGN